MLVLHVLAICLAASDLVFGVEVADYSVRITTEPSQGPFKQEQLVQFFCTVEPTPAHCVTYSWMAVENAGGSSSSYFTRQIGITYDANHLHYCWYSCSASANGRLLGSADKLVEVQGLLETDEAITRDYVLHQRMDMSIDASNSLLAQFSISMEWHHNGTKLDSDHRISITNTSLSILNLTESDAGRYEVKIRSLGSDTAICDRNILPMLETSSLFAPITFLVQQSDLPTYNTEVVFLHYSLPVYQGTSQSFGIHHTFMVNAPAVLDVAGNVEEALFKDGNIIRDRDMHNISASFDNITTQFVSISYVNTSDIAGHYLHTAFTKHEKINNGTCSDYRNFYSDNIITFSDFIPIFMLYWKISSHAPITCPIATPTTCPTTTPITCRTASPQGGTVCIISGAVIFLVGLLCSALVGVGVLIAYIKCRSKTEPLYSLPQQAVSTRPAKFPGRALPAPPPGRHLPTPSGRPLPPAPSERPLPAPPGLYDSLDNSSDIVMYEDMGYLNGHPSPSPSLANANISEQKLPQHDYYVLEK